MVHFSSSAPPVSSSKLSPVLLTTCLSKRLIAPGVYELRLTKPEGFAFTPGQFVLFDVPLLCDPTDVQVRAYSIASAPSESDLLFVVKLVPGGRASAWVEHSVDVGVPISLRGPLGAFTLDRCTSKPYLFVATGTGIAPFRSQVRWALQELGDTRAMDLLFGVVRQEDLFWEEAWRKLGRRFPNLRVRFSFLSGRRGGSIQECVPQIVRDPCNVTAYVCGSEESVLSVRDLLATLHVPQEEIHSESYV